MRSTQKTHWYLVSVYIGYVQKKKQELPEGAEGEAPEYLIRGERKLNVMITPTRKQITEKTMDDIRQLSLAKMRDVYKVDPQDVSDFVIESVSHLGIMSEAEYFDKS